MRKIIINADDYGMVKSVNDGIINAYNNGMVSSTTIMANMCSIEEMKRLFAEAPGIGIGVHLNLTQGLPLTKFITKSTNGNFTRNQTYANDYDLKEAEAEFIAQIEKVLQAGIKITHFDSHHHIHLREILKPVVCKLAERYHVPVRALTNDIAFDQSFYDTTVSLETLQNIIMSTAGTIEIMTHPAFVDEALKAITAYSDPRAIELAILISPELKEFYRVNNLVKATY